MDWCACPILQAVKPIALAKVMSISRMIQQENPDKVCGQ